MRNKLKKTISTSIILIMTLICMGCSLNNAVDDSLNEQSNVSVSASNIAEEHIADSTASEADTSYIDDIIFVDDSFPSFRDAISYLECMYGNLRIQTVPFILEDHNSSIETNGLCFLYMEDFDNDGDDDLFAVCKSEEEFSYTGYIFTQENHEVKCVFKNEDITRTSNGNFDELNIKNNSQEGLRVFAGYENYENSFSYTYGFDKGTFRLISSHCSIWNAEEEEYYRSPCRVSDKENGYPEEDSSSEILPSEERPDDSQEIEVELRMVDGESLVDRISELKSSVKEVKDSLEIKDTPYFYSRSSYQYISPDEADYRLYKPVIENLEEKYGSLRLGQTDSGSRYAKGLCYLNLIDLNNNNIKELIALCKNDNDYGYHCYIYSIERGKVSCVLVINDLGFADYGEDKKSEDNISTISMWITNDAKGNSAIIDGHNWGYETTYEIYGYDGFNYRLLHETHYSISEDYSVDREESSKMEYDKIVEEWSLKEKPNPLSDGWTPSETCFCFYESNCERIDIEFLTKMIEKTKKDVFGSEMD